MTDYQLHKECITIAEKYPWLAEEIAAVAEQAYRRGYQQGASCGASNEAIARWRFSPAKKSRYKTAAIPPPGKGSSERAIDRHSCEAINASIAIASIMRHTR